jgi:CheY-like chemotaxis protein
MDIAMKELGGLAALRRITKDLPGIKVWLVKAATVPISIVLF